MNSPMQPDLDDKCESTAYVNGERRRCHLPEGHEGSHVHDGDNIVVGWENHDRR